HNAQINQVNNLHVLQGDAKILSQINGLFDVVVANINRNILLNDMPMFREIMSEDAVLILSGFYDDDIPMLKEKASSLNLSLTEVKEKNEWRACVFHAKKQ
ncbi:MAG: 50S ribosomal protein L11 methyltransferase, partial [Prevotella sp.]|nr:50S ribosomal protein L11 methyltransferase [Prevotella sp.]